MESIDLTATKKVAKILVDMAPRSCREVTLKSKINEEGDSAEFLYNYVKIDGSSGWFVPDSGNVDNHIHDLLLRHRNFFVSQGQPKWVGCTLTVDVEHGDVSMDLQYD